jgi:hypothetical protein
MHYLARRKIAIADKIGSRALMADAMEAVTCGWLSAVVVVMRLSLAPLNLIVCAKTNGGMGGLYRSQLELLPLFKKGSAPHVNNVELGKRRRWRSNVWTYTGASSLGSDARRGLKDRPTVKPTALLEDALLEVSNRGDIVIDPFPCSGSTLIAAEATGRVCRGVKPRRRAPASREDAQRWPLVDRERERGSRPDREWSRTVAPAGLI